MRRAVEIRLLSALFSAVPTRHLQSPEKRVMKIIIPPSDLSQTLLGPQRVQPSVSYRESTFLLRVPCDDGTLLFHTLTGELLLLEEESPEESDELIQARFFVPEGFDEQKQVRDLRNMVRLVHPRKHITDFTIFTTTDCNARCYYCFENSRPRFPMSPETAEETAAHIRRMCGGKDVKLRWFGGEPLYNREAIRIITDKLKQYGIPYTSYMTTNGFYLDAETVRTAVNDWHLKSIQITLDGTRENYNRIKAYTDGGSDPFSRVLDHIGIAMDAGITVSVRLNVGPKNAEDLQLLAEQLAQRFPDRSRLHVYAALLVNFFQNTRDTVSQAEKARIGTELIKIIYRLGLGSAARFSNKPSLCRCMADDDRAEAILPDGRIAKCEQIDEDVVIGHIAGDRYDLSAIAEWRIVEELPTCKTCVLYPRCVNVKKCGWTRGGCTESARAMSLCRLQQDILAAYGKTKTQQNTEN